jgi:cytochrome c oxidase subunit 2
MVSQAKRLSQSLLATLFGLVSLFSASIATAEPGRWQTNMPQGVTALGQDIYGLHMLIFWISTIIGIAVFAWMFYSIYAYRKSRGAKAANFHENTTVEVLWTVVPFIILIAMAFPATKTMIDVYDTEDADLDILVTGYQWKWSYEYLNENGENVKFFSNLVSSQDQIYGREDKGENYLREVDNPLVLPVGKKARFLITANDVIHSWWVPDLAVKKDAIPGFINETHAKPLKEGVYRGQCAELCGKDHGFMPIVVNVTSEEEFNNWMAEKQAEAAELKTLMDQQFSLAELVDRGEKIYQTSCLACHGDKGQGGVGKAIAGSAYATGPVANHLDIIVYGSKSNPAMQAFGGQLNDLDLAAVVTYQRNAFGNNMGDSVQAVDVYNYKKGQ